jgi:hypothetical protein
MTTGGNAMANTRFESMGKILYYDLVFVNCLESQVSGIQKQEGFIA